MKLALYIDPFISPTSTFYTLILLQQELQKNNHQLVFHIPDKDTNTTQNEDCYINKELAIKYNYNIIWDFPDPQEYDILLLAHIWSKKWNKHVDTRKIITEEFTKLNKMVLCLKLDTTQEHRFVNSNVIYGINSNFRFNLSEHWTLPNNARTFQFHQISNYKFEKPDYLSEIDFYNKYKLDPEKKIITFFMSRYKKWYDSKLEFTYPIHWFFKNIKAVKRILKRNGYQLVFKLHRSDGNEIINKYKLQKLTIIDNYDTYELIKYSSRALSFGTSMVYELYLYDLPVMEIGRGIYYPGWLSFESRAKPMQSPLQKYNNGIDLIYGMVIPYKQLKFNLEKVLKQFIESQYDIDRYRFKTKHPIYGNSYNATIESIAIQLINIFDKK
jgi:hypothetical protein